MGVKGFKLALAFGGWIGCCFLLGGLIGDYIGHRMFD